MLLLHLPLCRLLHRCLTWSDEEADPPSFAWRYKLPSCADANYARPLLLRSQPDPLSTLSGAALKLGEEFEVSSACAGSGGVVWLCEASGQGWAPDRIAGYLSAETALHIRICERSDV